MHSIEKLAAAARIRDLSYLALTDHSHSLAVTRGLAVERLMEQREELAAFNNHSRDFTVLHGTEMDILPNRTLDFPDEVLKELDFIIASIHPAFKQSREQLTARVVAAMRNPWVIRQVKEVTHVSQEQGDRRKGKRRFCRKQPGRVPVVLRGGREVDDGR